jgi:hypothetical protein
MLGTNVVVAEQADLFLRVENDDPGLVCEAFEYEPTPPRTYQRR